MYLCIYVSIMYLLSILYQSSTYIYNRVTIIFFFIYLPSIYLYLYISIDLSYGQRSEGTCTFIFPLNMSSSRIQVVRLYALMCLTSPGVIYYTNYIIIDYIIHTYFIYIRGHATSANPSCVFMGNLCVTSITLMKYI